RQLSREISRTPISSHEGASAKGEMKIPCLQHAERKSDPNRRLHTGGKGRKNRNDRESPDTAHTSTNFKAPKGNGRFFGLFCHCPGATKPTIAVNCDSFQRLN